MSRKGETDGHPAQAEQLDELAGGEAGDRDDRGHEQPDQPDETLGEAPEDQAEVAVAAPRRDALSAARRRP